MSKICGYTDSGQKFGHCIFWVRFELLYSEVEEIFKAKWKLHRQCYIMYGLVFMLL